MNERIKKLGLEAADWLDDQESFNTAHAMQLYQKKFAELIIAECCVALHPMLRDMISRTQAVDMIVSHFRDEQDV
jgi:mannose/cellobiose epimerase-like protein (N-acyl-D-glucosamine 2-epimerase family)